jgi:protein-serine/threonine kinase
VQETRHPNLLNVVGKAEILENINTIAFRSDAPDHISTWKQFCKTQMSLFHTLSIFRQLTSAIAHLNGIGIIHRDVHPTRLHMHNGILKFNIIGLPYNFKKLMKSSNFSGHISYSAPELISEG